LSQFAVGFGVIDADLAGDEVHDVDQTVAGADHAVGVVDARDGFLAAISVAVDDISGGEEKFDVSSLWFVISTFIRG